MTKNNDTHIFDDVFRTMEEHTPELLLPLINEVFHTNYPEGTKITRLADKRHLLQQLVETDSCLSIGNKLYHFECESNTNNGTIAIRMFQYDVTVALEGKRYKRQLEQIEKEEDRRQRFLEEYENICSWLVETLGKENPLAYSELHKLMQRIQEYVLRKRSETKKGVQQIMGGHVLESWKEEMIRIGHAEGQAEGKLQILCSLVQEGLLTAEIAAEKAELSLEAFNDKLRCHKESVSRRSCKNV